MIKANFCEPNILILVTNGSIDLMKVTNPCNHVCMCKHCTDDLSISHQLRDIDESKLVHSHNSKERQDCICIVMVCRYSKLIKQFMHVYFIQRL